MMGLVIDVERLLHKVCHVSDMDPGHIGVALQF
jgi:hypothetical protein